VTNLGGGSAAYRQVIQTWIVLCIGIVVSAGLFYLVRSWESRSARVDFSFLAESQESALQKEIQQRITNFDNIHSLYRATDFVDRKEFHDFVSHTIAQDNAIINDGIVLRYRMGYKVMKFFSIHKIRGPI